MKTGRNATILILVLGLVGQAYAQNGQVQFRGTVTTDEAHDVVPVCYGDYHVTAAIEQVLEDPNGALAGLTSVQVCYEQPLGLVSGTVVEVFGYYWGGVCPKQYCGRVQILDETDYITSTEGHGGKDWAVVGDHMYSVPPGNVGIGASEPQEKLHVVGNLLLQGASPVWMKLISDLGSDVGISMTTTGAGVNTWEILRVGDSADLLIKERFPYPPFFADRMVVRTRSGNVGIGTSQPSEKLHVVGATLLEAPAGAGQFDEPLRVVKEGAGRQLMAYFLNPQDGSGETEVQLAGGKALPWGWSIKGANGLFSISNISVLPPAVNVTSTGKVGLGITAPQYRLELPNTASEMGQGRANAWKTYSSGRWKTNVRTIQDAMDKVRRLRGVYFDWKEQGTHDVGMIAEEVGRVIPEIVDYEANGTDASSLAYDRLVALLVEALKEQDARITELEQAVTRNKQLEQRLDTLERLLQQRTVPAR